MNSVSSRIILITADETEKKESQYILSMLTGTQTQSRGNSDIWVGLGVIWVRGR